HLHHLFLHSFPTRRSSDLTLFFGLAIVCGLLLTPLRREFLKPWIWLGGLVALLVFLPNLIWEYQHNFATLELLRNVQKMHKNVVDRKSTRLNSSHLVISYA